MQYIIYTSGTNFWSRDKYSQEHWHLHSSHGVGYHLHLNWWSMPQLVVMSILSLSQVPNVLLYLGLSGVPSGEDFFI